MSQKKYHIVVDEETHTRLKQLALEVQISPPLTMGNMVKSLINMMDNRVAHAQKNGILPTENPIVLNKAAGRDRYEYYSNYMHFVALHLLEIGAISEKQFDSFRESLPALVFMFDEEFVDKKNFDEK